MLKMILSSLCVLAAATPLSATLSPANIAGRWHGDTYETSGGNPLTLDIVACGSGWCGIKVAANNECQGTALKIDAGKVEDENITFTGTLQLAPKTEAYVVQATIFAPVPEMPDQPMTMQLTGDTGGQFRAYRRSFPFEAQMVRTQDAVCHAPQTVSSLE